MLTAVTVIVLLAAADDTIPTTTPSSGVNALYPAVAAIIVALVGFAGNVVLARRGKKAKGIDDEDTNVITAMATMISDGRDREETKDRRIAVLEEQLRQCQEQLP